MVAMVTAPSMVNPVVLYGPRYGQFGELDARWDNYLGRGHFTRINPATSLATACQRQCWSWSANQDGVSGGLRTPGGVVEGSQRTHGQLTWKPEQSSTGFHVDF